MAESRGKERQPPTAIDYNSWGHSKACKNALSINLCSHFVFMCIPTLDKDNFESTSRVQSLQNQLRSSFFSPRAPDHPRCNGPRDRGPKENIQTQPMLFLLAPSSPPLSGAPRIILLAHGQCRATPAIDQSQWIGPAWSSEITGPAWSSFYRVFCVSNEGGRRVQSPVFSTSNTSFPE